MVAREGKSVRRTPTESGRAGAAHHGDNGGDRPGQRVNVSSDAQFDETNATLDNC